MNNRFFIEKNLANGSQILREVLAGLTHRPKRLPAKLLYDQKGSELFEKICQVEEYYPWRSEIEILQNYSSEIADVLGEKTLLIEPGSGAGVKVRELLKELKNPAAYVPIEISKEILQRMSAEFKIDFPHIKITPIEGDFFNISVEASNLDNARRIVFFPGSTIGNFDSIDAIKLLKKFKTIIGDEGGILIGFDLKKNRKVLERAYNDSLGLTSNFNLNLLSRINKETDANFNLDSFIHHAFYNEEEGRIEMHLVSLFLQQVRVHESVFIFQKNESIHTENSYKYTIDEFKILASKARLKMLKYWLDEKKNFCVAYLTSDYV